MERSAYAPMQPSSEVPNPLRPYYRPPSIGHGTDIPSKGFNTNTTSKPSSSSTSSSYIPDIDYRDILGTSDTNGPSALESVRSLTDQMAWKYSSVFLAQPFEVAKMILQVRCASDGQTLGHSRGKSSRGSTTTRRHRSSRDSQDPGSVGRRRRPSPSDSEDDDEEPNYFTSSAPGMRQRDPRSESPSSLSATSRDSKTHSRPKRRRSDSPSSSTANADIQSGHLDLRRADSLTEVISQLWVREGAWGIWKGTNVTFLHNLLSRTLESWLRGLLCAVLNLPDSSPGTVGGGNIVGGLDLLDSPNPIVSLGVAIVAAGAVGLCLVPLDVARTRIMLTPTTTSPRSILPTLRTLPTWLCSSTLALPSLLHATLPTLISGSTPLLLRSQFNVDPIISPAYYNIATFLSSTLELFVKLPVETVLRRAQMRELMGHHRRRRGHGYADPEDVEDGYEFETTVEIGPYNGVLGSMWRIAREEGTRFEKTRGGSGGGTGAQAVFRPQKGQGVQGLWRGWRVGLWALVGVWGTAGLGSLGGRGSEF